MGGAAGEYLFRETTGRTSQGREVDLTEPAPRIPLAELEAQREGEEERQRKRSRLNRRLRGAGSVAERGAALGQPPGSGTFLGDAPPASPPARRTLLGS